MGLLNSKICVAVFLLLLAYRSVRARGHGSLGHAWDPPLATDSLPLAPGLATGSLPLQSPHARPGPLGPALLPTDLAPPRLATDA